MKGTKPLVSRSEVVAVWDKLTVEVASRARDPHSLAHNSRS
jgi:hypothetical protein